MKARCKVELRESWCNLDCKIGDEFNIIKEGNVKYIITESGQHICELKSGIQKKHFLIIK